MEFSQRTSIRAVEISGYRSIEHLQLDDLPALVVLLGKNGSGKSNLMRAIRLALAAAGHFGTPSANKAELSYPQAKAQLGLRPQDFRRGGPPQITIRLALNLGPKFSENSLGFEWPRGYKVEFSTLFEDIGDSINVSVFDASIQGDIPQTKAISQAFQEQSATAALIRDIKIFQNHTIQAPHLQIKNKLFQTWLSPVLVAETLYLDRAGQAIEILELKSQEAKEKIPVSFLFETRFRNALLNYLGRYSDAERRVEEEPIKNQPSPQQGIQEELARASRSENSEVAQALIRLGRALGRVKIFGEETPEQVPLRAAESEVFKEHLLMITPPGKKEMPLHNLSSGERQIVLMLGHQVLRPWPIAFIEEPEAHLHKELMLKLAAYLQGSVEPHNGASPDTDQLWLATHHHAFALAPHFYEVSLDQEGRTTVQKRPRAEAIRHFYEPNPYWDALEDLARDGLEDGEVLMLDEHGKEVTVADLRASIRGDRELANRFVLDSLRSVLLSLKPS